MSYIQYHATGTTGDYITVLLESTGAFYNFKQFELNDHGRMRAVGDKPEVAAVIENTLWGSRDWSDFDEDLLNSLTDKHIIINTSEYYQIRQLRNAGCDWPIIRIKYSEHLAYWIKKAILTKAYSKVFEEDGSKHPNEQKLIEKGLWALLFFKIAYQNIFKINFCVCFIFFPYVIFIVITQHRILNRILQMFFEKQKCP